MIKKFGDTGSFEVKSYKGREAIASASEKDVAIALQEPVICKCAMSGELLDPWTVKTRLHCLFFCFLLFRDNYNLIFSFRCGTNMLWYMRFQLSVPPTDE